MQQIKVLLVGAFGKGALEHQFIRVLKNCGVRVDCFDSQQKVNELKAKHLFNKILVRLQVKYILKDLNHQLTAYVQESKPQVVLVFKGMDFFPETIAFLKSIPGVLVCNYNPDHPFTFFSSGSGNAFVRDAISHYHLYFSYSRQIVEDLKKKFHSNAHWIPFGFDETRKTYLNSVTNKDVVFIGAWDRERADTLGNLHVDHLKIYGPQPWKKSVSKYPVIQQSFQGKSIYDQEYDEVTAAATCSINLLRKQNTICSSHNMRSFEIPGVGGLMIANRTDEHLLFFEEDKEVLLFDTPEELKDKISALQKGVYPIALLKQAAQERCIKSGYAYADRIKAFYSIVQAHI